MKQCVKPQLGFGPTLNGINSFKRSGLMQVAQKSVLEDGSSLLTNLLPAEDVNIQHATPVEPRLGPSSEQPSTSSCLPSQHRLDFDPTTPSTTDASASLDISPVCFPKNASPCMGLSQQMNSTECC